MDNLKKKTNLLGIQSPNVIKVENNSRIQSMSTITDPKRAFPFTMQYGISIFLHKAGSQTTNSIGSTSWAITTSWALFWEENVFQKAHIQEERLKRPIAYRNRLSEL